MKKVFPAIVVLISLSLLGIIYIQVNWIKNAAIVKKEQQTRQIYDALNDVRLELVNREVPGVRFKLERSLQGGKRPVTLLSDQISDFMKSQIPLSEKFTAIQVNEIINKIFQQRNLHINYEFGVTAFNSFFGGYQMQSPNFFAMLEDTSHNKIFSMPLVGDNNDLSAVRMMQQEMLVLVVPEAKNFILKNMGWMIVGAITFTLIMLIAFYLTLSTMLRQKKLSEIKSDFINNMTHEFKTPLATISLAVDAIGNEKVMHSPDKIRYFSGIIKEENRRMHKQVESILQSALLERQELKLNFQDINVHELIRKTADNLQLQLQQKQGRIYLDLHAANPVLKADEVHFSNIIFNLLDNAIKYCKDHPEIRIATENTKQGLNISISDNGIGMSRETQARIFEKFYRAHTGNLHNVKGFGLGLAYVKEIVDAHHGRIKVESAVGKGSRFDLEFPQAG